MPNRLVGHSASSTSLIKPSANSTARVPPSSGSRDVGVPLEHRIRLNQRAKCLFKCLRRQNPRNHGVLFGDAFRKRTQNQVNVQPGTRSVDIGTRAEGSGGQEYRLSSSRDNSAGCTSFKSAESTRTLSYSGTCISNCRRSSAAEVDRLRNSRTSNSCR